jgi:GNAT superfamily N-acetyltransferase
MRVEVSEESITTLEGYAGIPIAFEVSKVLQVEESPANLSGFLLIERHLDAPYVKDYDAINGEHPLQWASHFDLANWGMLVARDEGKRVGGAVVAFDTLGLMMLEGRRDMAVLWDIRVSPEYRHRGVGFALLQAAETWAKARDCQQLTVETQNINVAACRFYAQQGFRLTTVDRFVYPELPDEIQLIWCKKLFYEPSSEGLLREQFSP